MMKRRKPDRKEDVATTPGEDNTLRLRFKGDVVEFTPSSDYPILILQTPEFEAWSESIVDVKTSTRITGSIDKMQRGLFGDWKEVGVGLSELRIDFGPGYRIYYARYREIVVILVGGGDKSSQRKDIASARRVWGALKDEIAQI